MLSSTKTEMTDAQTDKDVFDLVSKRSFSKERMKGLLKDSILSLIEKLLSGKQISSVNGQVSISFIEDDEPLSIDLNTTCPDICSNDALNKSSCVDAQQHISHFIAANNEYRGQKKSEFEASLDVCRDISDSRRNSLLLVPNDGRRDSDVESGYSSSSELRNALSKDGDLQLAGGRRRSSLLQSLRDDRSQCDLAEVENEEDNEEPDPKLVIDLTENLHKLSTKSSDRLEDLKREEKKETNNSTDRIESIMKDEQNQEAKVPIPTICIEEDLEMEESDRSSSTDISEFDSEKQTTGSSSENSEDIKASPHPQSMVSPLPSGLLECKLCHQLLNTPDSVTKHAYDEHGVYSCSICFRTFTAKNNMKRHIRLHTGQKPYKCPHCPLTFARRDDLKGHKLRHDYTKPYRCGICKKGYTDRACVKNHMAKEHGSTLMHLCPQCGESFESDEDFSIHKKSHPELQQYSCKTCCFIGNNTLMIMKHNLIHQHELFSCKPCNAYFADPFDYSNHLRKHKKDKGFSSYACCFCKVSFNSYEQFVRHEYSHAQGKVYTCKICSVQIKGKHAFQDHCLTHTSKSTADMENDAENNTDISEDQSQSSKSNTSYLSHDTLLEPIPMVVSPPIEAALDLRVKKPEHIPKHVPGPMNIVAEMPRIPVSPSSTATCIPRNGYAPATFGQTAYSSSTARSSLNDFENTTCSPFQNSSSPPGFDQHDLQIKTQRAFHVRSSRAPSPYETYAKPQRKDVRTLLTKYFAARGPMNSSQNRTEKNRTSHASTFEQLEKTPVNNNRISGIVIDKETGRLTISMSNADGGYIRNTPQRETQSFIKSEPASPEDQRYEIFSRNMFNPFFSRQSSSGSTVESPIQVDRPDFFRILSDQCESKSQPIPSPLTQPLYVDVNSSHESFLYSRQPHRPYTNVFHHPQPKASSMSSTCKRQHSKRSHDTQQRETQFSDNKPHHVSSFQTTTETTQPTTSPSSTAPTTSTPSTSTKFTCGTCQETFSSFSELESHSVSAHKRYPCRHCGKSFTARPNRDRHARFHTGERPYKCQLCHKAFHRGDDLKYHVTTVHAREARRLLCGRCPAAFAWRKDLEKHIRGGKCNL